MTRRVSSAVDDVRDRGGELRGCRAGTRQQAGRRPAGDGDVRARRRHVADERVDLGGGRGPRHDGERRPVGDRPRGAGLGRVHPDQQQDRRPLRAQAGLRARSARLRRRRRGDDARPGSHRDHHLLGDAGWARRLAPPARHAVADPRQLRRRRAEEGLRPGRGRGRDRRRRRTAARRVHHHLSVVARRLPARGRDHRHRAVRRQAGARRAVHRAAWHRRRRRRPLRLRHGRHRARHPRVAGGRRGGRRPAGDRRGRAGGAGLLARRSAGDRGS